MKYLTVLLSSIALSALHASALPESDNVIIDSYINSDEFCPRIAIVTVLPNDSLAFDVEIGTESKRSYCEKHGYDFIVAQAPLTTCYGLTSKKLLDRSWTKLALTAMALEEYDYVFAVDPETLIVNPHFSLEGLTNQDKDLVVAGIQCEPASFLEFNTRCWFMKNSRWSKQLIKQTWINGEKSNPRFEPGTAEEALIATLGTLSKSRQNPKNHMSIVCPMLMRQAQNYQYGDFMVYFPSLKKTALRQAMTNFNKVSEKSEPIKPLPPVQKRPIQIDEPIKPLPPVQKRPIQFDDDLEIIVP